MDESGKGLVGSKDNRNGYNEDGSSNVTKARTAAVEKAENAQDQRKADSKAVKPPVPSKR